MESSGGVRGPFTRIELSKGIVRLSRQSLRDMAYYCSLSWGEGRDMIQRGPDIVMYIDAADVGYMDTLEFRVEAGAPGLWEGQGFGGTRDRAHWIMLRELCA